MSPTYRAFAERFGEGQARAIVDAAEQHKNGIHDNPGSDRFRWAICITIGYQCFDKMKYRVEHGITASADEIKQWIKDEANLRDHDGDVDFLALFAGIYDEYITDAYTQTFEEE